MPSAPHDSCEYCFFQAEDGIRDYKVTGVQTCALPISKAILVVTGPRSPNAGELVPMTFDTALAGSGIVAASVDRDAGNAIFAATGKALADVQQSLDSGNPHIAGFEIPISLTVRAKIERERHTAYNVAGYL